MNRNDIDSVLRSLRRVNFQRSFFGQTVAIRFGLSESDVEALELLIDTGAATAGKLSDLMGLTTGAVTRVIDRLEQAGYVRRVPDPADRRRVIVELVPEKMAAVEATMARVGEKGAEEISQYSEADLAVINDFLTRMEAITHDEATALRDAPDPTAGGSEHAAPIGGLERARLLFRSGANELLIRGGTEAEDLYRAKFEGPVPQVRLRDGIVSIQYKGRFQWDWRERRADVALNTGLPWDIEVVGGANKVQGKLAPARCALVRAHRRRRPAPPDARQADRHRSDQRDRRSEQHPDRATDRDRRSAARDGRGRRRRVRQPEAGLNGRPHGARVHGREPRARRLRGRGHRRHEPDHDRRGRLRGSRLGRHSAPDRHRPRKGKLKKPTARIGCPDPTCPRRHR